MISYDITAYARAALRRTSFETVYRLSIASSVAVMSSGNLGQLQSYVNELSSAAKIITDHCPDANLTLASHISIPNNAPSEVHRARRNLLAVTARLQALLAEPADFIQQLASQVRDSSPNFG